jgi:hypothetical protein
MSAIISPSFGEVGSARQERSEGQKKIQFTNQVQENKKYGRH